MTVRKRIKRALFEWAAIAAATAAIGCLLLWLISVCSVRADFSLLFSNDRGLSVAAGTIAISNHIDSIHTMEETEKKYPGAFPGIGPGWKMPGVRYRYFTINSTAHWLTSISLLYPVVVFALLALLLFRQYRTGKALAELPKPAARATSAHPLD